MLLHKLLQLTHNMEKCLRTQTLIVTGSSSQLHTCWSSAGVAKRAVTPLMMAEKEKEPTPYLKGQRQIRVYQMTTPGQ